MGKMSVANESANASATKVSKTNESASEQTTPAKVFVCDGSGGSTGGCTQLQDGSGGSTGGCGEECNPVAGNDFTFRLTSALLQLQCQLGVLEDIVTATERGRFGR